MVAVLLCLMGISLLVISSHTTEGVDPSSEPFLTTAAKNQLRAFGLGWVVFLVCASLDYNKLREWAWILYGLTLLALVGLFFTDPIARVHRWYRVPFLPFNFQPSEYAKLSVVITLSWYLERSRGHARRYTTALWGGLIALVPAVLILKQPDLGTACVLYPITLGMFYFGNQHPRLVRWMSWAGGLALACVLMLFMGIVSQEQIRPYARVVMKDYQFDRLDPHTPHQRAAMTAIALGGVSGTGWRKAEYAAEGWLPASHTDSVFPAFGEEFGLVGLLFLIALYYGLIYFCCQVTAVAKDHFGRLLSAGITVYLAIHIVVNMGMMCGVLPITGVPLILVTYGGSSVLLTMAALGLLQSIYSRRYMF